MLVRAIRPGQEVLVRRVGTRHAAVILAAAVLAAGGIAVAILLPSDEELRQRASAGFAERFGTNLAIESVHWQLLPSPVVVVRGARTEQKEPIEIRQLSVYPNLSRALRRWKFSVERLELDGAVIPTASLAAFRGKQDNAMIDRDLAPVGHVRFRNVTWMSRTGIALPIEGDIDFDPLWRPRRAHVRRADFTPMAQLTVVREGAADRWKARVVLGGGTADGVLALRSGKDGTLTLGGTLAPRVINVATAAQSLNRRSPVGGKANGNTVVSAHGKTAGELGSSLRLRTEFKMRPATILRFDLDKAIRTAGREHAGQTTLQSLTGVMDMQNTGRGTVLRFSELEAHAGSFTATGDATIFNRKIEGQGTLDVVQGVVGVPFTISGTTREPKASVPPGVFAGAAVGTAVLPGIGTVLGARIGGSLGRLLRDRPEPPDTPPTKPSPTRP
jgi:hypothetical protein